MQPPSPPPSLLLLLRLLLLLLLLLLLMLLMLLLRCRYSLLRAFQKTQNEKQSVMTGRAPRCIAGHEAAAAQQQHQQQQQRRRWRWRRRGSTSGELPFGVSGWLLCCVSVAERVCSFCVCGSWLSLVALVARFRPHCIVGIVGLRSTSYYTCTYGCCMGRGTTTTTAVIVLLVIGDNEARPQYLQ